MFVLKVENARGETLRLTQNESTFQVLSVSGLNPPPATINQSVVAGMDGSKFNSARLDPRNIVITLKLRGDIENNRLLLYRYFSPKQWCKIYYANTTRSVYIEGYVEANECDIFTSKETAQISILCGDPYFKSLNEIVCDISNTLALFEFPFAFGAMGVEAGTTTDEAIEFSASEHNRITNVINTGVNETGLIIEVEINQSISEFVIRNIDDGSFFGLRHDFVPGDRVVITTTKGNKSVHLIREGTSNNVFNCIINGSSWFQLATGDNQFAYEAIPGAENVFVYFRYCYLYNGV